MTWRTGSCGLKALFERYLFLNKWLSLRHCFSRSELCYDNRNRKVMLGNENPNVSMALFNIYKLTTNRIQKFCVLDRIPLLLTYVRKREVLRVGQSWKGLLGLPIVIPRPHSLQATNAVFNCWSTFRFEFAALDNQLLELNILDIGLYLLH
jgi:hypothetical protein